MSITISDVQTRVASKLHGTSVNKVRDFYGLCLEAAGNVLLSIDPKETIRVSQISPALYDSVYDYIVPDDLKGDRILDIAPQVKRAVGDRSTPTTEEEFDLRKSSGSFAIAHNSGVKTIRISKSLTAGILLNDCNTTTSNGTWAATASAQNISTDTLNFVSGSGSVRFDLAGGGTSGYIENSTLTSVDLSTLTAIGALFMWVYIPSTSITAVALRWGSSSANYYSVSATTTHFNTSFVVGWNLLRFDYSSATETGTVDDAAVDYLRVTFTYSSVTTISAVRVDNIIGYLGSIYNMVYYSKYLFKTSAGTWIEKPTALTDIVNLDTESYNVFIYELAYLVVQELAGENNKFDLEFWKGEKKAAWDQYKSANKSQAKKRRTVYWRDNKPRRR